jgi:tubulin polyglutamylase TTLL6/13
LDSQKRSCNIYWIDTHLALQESLAMLQPWQCINHFPGMVYICRKSLLENNIELMRKKFPKEYGFCPKTYCLPYDMYSFKKKFGSSGKSRSTYILKPDGGAQGKGIFLTRQLENIPQQVPYVAQEYICNPLLIDDKKFDLRIYVLVTSCNPLRVYLFRDGLVRLCTEEFTRPTTTNIKERCMHLTNYSVNKKSEKFSNDKDASEPGVEEDEGGTGHKRSISWLLNSLKEKVGSVAVERLWKEISDISAKTVLCNLPKIQKEYNFLFGKNSETKDPSSIPAEPTTGPVDGNAMAERSKSFLTGGGSRCFELLGVDIMIDDKMKPWLIEVNHLPSCEYCARLIVGYVGRPYALHSFSCVFFRAVVGSIEEVDKSVKKKLLRQTLDVVRAHSGDQKRFNTKSKEDRLHFKINVKDKENVEINAKKWKAEAAEIYRQSAPEKIEQIPHIFEKHKGKEAWLVERMKEKYVCSNASDNDSSGVDRDEKEGGGSTEQMNQFELEEELLEDFDRIYPPREGDISTATTFAEMEAYVCETAREKERRLTEPMHKRENKGDTPSRPDPPAFLVGKARSNTDVFSEFEAKANQKRKRRNTNQRPSDVLRETIREPTIREPTEQQIAAFERMSLGLRSSNSLDQQNNMQSNISRGSDTMVSSENMDPNIETSRFQQTRRSKIVSLPVVKVAVLPVSFAFDG